MTILDSLRPARARPSRAYEAGSERVCEQPFRPLRLSGAEGGNTDGGHPDSR